MRVWARAKVDVVKILRIVPIEEYAAIAMTAGILGALHAKGQNEIGHLRPDERNVPGCAPWVVLLLRRLMPNTVLPPPAMRP